MVTLGVAHRARHGTAQAYMDFPYSCAFNDRSSIAMADASAGHDGNPALCGFHQCGNRVDPFEASLFAARGENPICSGLAHAFQCAEDIRRHVKGPVKCDGERSRQFHQLPSPLDIDVPFRIEDAENDAVCAQFLRSFDVAAHDFHFLLGVAEVARPWANDGMQTNRYPGTNRRNQSGAGGYSPFEKVAAQLDTHGPAGLRRDRRCNRIDADFNEHRFRHIPARKTPITLAKALIAEGTSVKKPPRESWRHREIRKNTRDSFVMCEDTRAERPGLYRRVCSLKSTY
jgi:hypothetical protein